MKVRESQIARLARIKAERNNSRVREALDALTAAAQSGQGNLLALSIEAVRRRATVGELSDALEKVFGRHRADIQKVTGVYAAASILSLAQPLSTALVMPPMASTSSMIAHAASAMSCVSFSIM